MAQYSRPAYVQSQTPQRAGLLWMLSLIVLLLYAGAVFVSYASPLMFIATVLVIYAACPPRYLMSPRNIATAYYLIFYGVAVAGAERYEGWDFSDPIVVRCYAMIVTSFVICYLVLFHTENARFADRFVARVRAKADAARSIKLRYCILPTLATIGLAFWLIEVTGGLAHWIRDPGRAFLGREGGGVIYLSMIIVLPMGACLAGVYSAHRRNYVLPLLFFALVLVLTPVLGGKARVFMTICFLVLPWIFFAPVASGRTLFVVCAFVFVFSAITYVRNIAWITGADFLRYSLNYFSTFDMLVISVDDFEPGWLQTVFMPFNKFLTPLGIGDGTVFYDMSAWLTSIYFPHNWDLRCTEQWPVETDLYLSFHYFYGLPLFACFVAMVGLLFNLATRTRNAALALVSAYASFYLVTHLRSSLIIWTDFYTYPMWLMWFMLLHRVPLPQIQRFRRLSPSHVATRSPAPSRLANAHAVGVQ